MSEVCCSDVGVPFDLKDCPRGGLSRESHVLFLEALCNPRVDLFLLNDRRCVSNTTQRKVCLCLYVSACVT